MSAPTSPPPSDEELRRRRQEALRALAQNQPAEPPVAAPSSSSNSLPVEQPRRVQFATVRTVTTVPLWLRVGSVVAILVLAVGVVLHQLGLFPGSGTSGRHVVPGLVITPSLQGQDCTADAAWSPPDGKEIAVIGYQDQCPNDDPTSYNYEAGVLNVYSATTGSSYTILPDATVLALRNLPAAPAGAQPAFSQCRLQQACLELHVRPLFAGRPAAGAYI